MDGNGRWAKERGLERVYGHANGVASVRKAIKASLDMGVKVLTLYAFSQENWNRPAAEVEALMLLMVSNMKQELPSFIEQGVRFRYIGNRAALSDEVREEFDYCERQTAHCERLTLVIAVSYSAREELAMAAQKIARRAVEGEIRVEDIDVEMKKLNDKLKNETTKRGMENFSLLKAINDVANNRQLDERSQSVVNSGIEEMRKAGLSYSG
jgi:undecaprenyl diphosphate synthase